jgi:glycosyltransferase involved in cell wall biosynthesis
VSRVLLVTNVFPPQIGGPATFIAELANGLARAGHLVTVVCTSASPREDSDARRPYRVCRAHGGRQIALEARTRLLLVREMLRHRIILVNGLDAPASMIARGLGKRYVLKVVGDTVWETSRNMGLTTASIDEFQDIPLSDSYLRRVARRRALALERAARIIVPSEYLRGLVVKWGVNPSKVVVVRNGVTVSSPTLTGGDDVRIDAFRIVFCGRLTNWKGVETLLLAVARLPGVTATVVGDGPELPLAATLATQLGIAGRVTFTGRLPHDDVKRVMAQSHVLVLVSLYEGLSHTLLEACSLGIPCITSDCGGNPEVITSDINGYVVPYGDVEQLAKAIDKIAGDATLRHRLGEGSRQIAARFTMAETVRHTADVLMGGVVTGRS